jgi:hypothetical protein
MKVLLLIVASYWVAITLANGQNGQVVIFTERGEKFIAVLNGLRINDTYQTNVSIKDLNQEFYKLKVLWENPAAKPVNLNLYVKRGFETQYSLKRNNKGIYVLRYMGEAPIMPPPPPAAPAPVVQSPTNNQPAGGVNNGTQINVPVNVNVNVGGTQQAGGAAVPPPAGQPAPFPTNNPCGMPMTNQDFQFAKQSIASKNFEDSKLQMAKQLARDNCLLASQIREIMLLFNFEDTRLNFAKFAYPNCINKGNYFEVNNAFNFESSIEELNQYISTIK